MSQLASHKLPTLATILVATLLLAGLNAPAEAHEGRALDGVNVVARVDGRLHAVSVESGAEAVAVRADRGLGVIDLDRAEGPATAIDFQVQAEGPVRLEVLDLEGNVVRTLAEGNWAQGHHRLAWHHDAESGENLDDGLYVVRLTDTSSAAHVAVAR